MYVLSDTSPPASISAEAQPPPRTAVSPAALAFVAKFNDMQGATFTTLRSWLEAKQLSASAVEGFIARMTLAAHQLRRALTANWSDKDYTYLLERLSALDPDDKTKTLTNSLSPKKQMMLLGAGGVALVGLSWWWYRSRQRKPS